MPAPKGNQYWKIAFENGNLGRPKKYNPEELAIKINEWLEIQLNTFWQKEDFIKSGQTAGTKVYLETQTPLLIQDLCLYLGVNNEYFNDLEKSLDNLRDDKQKEDFSRIITHVRNVITVQKLQGAAVGAFNPMIIARIEGLKDKQDITSNDESISLNVNVSNKDLLKDLDTE